VRSHKIVIALAAVLSSCGSPSDPADDLPAPDVVVGCYRVSLGKWSGNKTSADPPSLIVFLDSLGTNLLEKGRTLARAYPSSAPFPFEMGWWQRPDHDRIEVVFTDGYVGTRLHVTWSAGDQSWKGLADAYTDQSPPIQATATVALTRQECQ